jgi:hypothetical protein
MKNNDVSREERAKVSVKKFAAIVTLHTFNHNMKLSFNIGEKTLESRGGIRFIAKRECP